MVFKKFKENSFIKNIIEDIRNDLANKWNDKKTNLFSIVENVYLKKLNINSFSKISKKKIIKDSN